MKWSENMGKLDRVLRLLVAAVIFFWIYFTDSPEGMTRNILLLLAVIFAVTAAIKTCPLYIPFGMDTRNKQD